MFDRAILMEINSSRLQNWFTLHNTKFFIFLFYSFLAQSTAQLIYFCWFYNKHTHTHARMKRKSFNPTVCVCIYLHNPQTLSSLFRWTSDEALMVLHKTAVLHTCVSCCLLRSAQSIQLVAMHFGHIHICSSLCVLFLFLSLRERLCSLSITIPSSMCVHTRSHTHIWNRCFFLYILFFAPFVVCAVESAVLRLDVRKRSTAMATLHCFCRTMSNSNENDNLVDIYFV